MNWVPILLICGLTACNIEASKSAADRGSQAQERATSHKSDAPALEAAEAQEADSGRSVRTEVGSDTSESSEADSNQSGLEADEIAADFPASLGEDLKTRVAIQQGTLSSDLWVKKVESVVWKDSCLEIAEAKRCERARIPGYRVILSTVTETFEFHTDRSGETVYQKQRQR